ncbi:MAG: hypothetical protein ACWGQW_01740 [bacterium]
MVEGPALVLMYRVIYNENGASFAWWDGSDWSPTGEMHDVDDLHKHLSMMGAALAIKHNIGNMVREIWTIGG